METYLIIGGIAVAIAAFLILGNKKKDKRSRRKPAIQGKNVEELIKDTVAPTVVGGGTGDETASETVITPAVVGGGTGTAAVSEEIATPPVPEDTSPDGWYKSANGFLYKDPDPNALWNFDVARRTKVIDILDLDPIGYLNIEIKTTYRPRKRHHQLFITGTHFRASIARSPIAKQGVLYLCDNRGRVHDFCISAEGAPTAGKYGNERNIVYTGQFQGPVWIIQVSDGEGLKATYVNEKIFTDRGKELEVNTKVFKG